MRKSLEILYLIAQCYKLKSDLFFIYILFIFFYDVNQFKFLALCYIGIKLDYETKSHNLIRSL
jgi:hypothetical protein